MFCTNSKSNSAVLSMLMTTVWYKISFRMAIYLIMFFTTTYFITICRLKFSQCVLSCHIFLCYMDQYISNLIILISFIFLDPYPFKYIAPKWKWYCHLFLNSCIFSIILFLIYFPIFFCNITTLARIFNVLLKYLWYWALRFPCWL